MRLDKLLQLAGYGSRRQVKQLIKAGQVTIDGHRAQTPNINVDSGLQAIFVAEKQITVGAETYWLMNKPAGVVSACQDREHQTVLDLLPPAHRSTGLYPIGRLDRDTEGLLLLTTNGPLGYRLLHPRHHVTKTYYVEVNALLDIDAPDFFAKGVAFLDGQVCQPAQLEIIDTGLEKSSAYLTIREGKFHQVKKMFLAYGVKVTYLKRICFAEFVLTDNLPVGHYRPLNREEEDLVRRYLKAT